MNSLFKAKNLNELITEFKKITSKAKQSTSPKLLKGKKRKAANEKAKEILAKYDGDYSNVSDEDKEDLRKYSGIGGLNQEGEGALNEYYTPRWMAEGVWDALASYGFEGGSVLEPSAGVGVFSDTKPKGALVTAIEYNETSKTINQILHPEDEVIRSSFEDIQQNPDIGNFDVVIGNPPYGTRFSDAKKDDKEYKNIGTGEEYFVLRSIDKAKAGGLIALILPSQVMDSPSLKNWRIKVSKKAEMLGAHRFPVGSFADTTVMTDLVIWRKHSDTVLELIENASKEKLEESKVLWETWLEGQWFKKDGKPYINGYEATQKMKFNQIKDVIKRDKSLTNEQIKQNLTRRFNSRIDWSVLDEALINGEIELNKYTEGDMIFRNGTQYQLANGEWVAVRKAQADENGGINQDRYGVSNFKDIFGFTAFSENLLNISYAQAKALFEDYRGECHHTFASIMRDIEKMPSNQREHVLKGIVLGRKINLLSAMIAQKNENSTNLNDEVGFREEHIQEYRERLSNEVLELKLSLKNHKITKKNLQCLSDENFSSFKDYQFSMDKNGNFSELLSGETKVEKNIQLNTDRIADVFELVSNKRDIPTLTLDDVRQFYTAKAIQGMNDEELTNYLCELEDVALNPDGTFSEMNLACSGNIKQKKASISNMLMSATTDAVKLNCIRQLDTLEARRTTIKIENVKAKLTDKWIPKDIILKFLHERGYNDFDIGNARIEYVIAYDKNKQIKIDKETGQPVKRPVKHYTADPNGREFFGYQWRGGVKQTKETEKFERDIEDYLNKGRLSAKQDIKKKNADGTFTVIAKSDAVNAGLRDKMRMLDRDFSNWLMASEFADEMESLYNDTFNDWIKPTYSKKDLELDNVSGAIKFMGYQNATIRRHSAEGNGLINFGTGLGKTLTALGLIQHNIQLGRTKRTAIVVPKSVLENWFYESELFFGADNMKDKVILGVEPERTKSGEIIRETVMKQEGDELVPATDNNGNIKTRVKLRHTSTKRIGEQLRQIAQASLSSVRIVIMTKDVYKEIPVSPKTLKANLDAMIEANKISNSGKYVNEGTGHKNAERHERFKDKYTQEGTAKNKKDFPYFETLLFDSVVVDEAHEFRNSQKGGSYRNNLAYLPQQAQADRSIDMAVKNNLIKSRNAGKGVFFLTATPTVNSPVDIFNMLSHIIPAKEFAKMGIFDSDDFIRKFGKTGEDAVTKLSGEIVMKEALIGFQNLEALRSIINRYLTTEDAKSVLDSVRIPELHEVSQEVEMSEEQASIYEHLRKRAFVLNHKDNPIMVANFSDEELQIMGDYPNDTTFGLIRKMDKVASDMDLYNDVVTFRFDKNDQELVQKALKKIPDFIEIREDEEEGEADADDAETLGEGSKKRKKVNKIKIAVDKTLELNADTLSLALTQDLADKFANELEKLGVKYTHPVTAKIAKFLEIAKEYYLDGGKHLVFYEEKTQHRKLAKIISDFIPCPIAQVGILNADTVAGIKGSKSNDDDDTDGLESIATAYNTGRYRILILNKKGECGINLHVQTKIMSHLSIPWNPKSITQRNGRGARVGSEQEKVDVYYFTSRGSFDDFRLNTVKRKAGWIEEMFQGDALEVDNADANTADEIAAMVAKDPKAAAKAQEEARALERKRVRQEQQEAEIAKVVSLLDLNKKLQVTEEQIKANIEKIEAGIKNAEYWIDKYTEWKSPIKKKQSVSELRELVVKKTKLEYELNNREKLITQQTKLRGQLEPQIKDGVLSEYPDILTNPENYKFSQGKVVRLNQTYVIKLANGLTTLGVAKEFYKNSVKFVTFDKNTKKTLNVELDKVIELASVEHEKYSSEADLIEGVEIGQISSLIDRERFIEMFEEGLLNIYGDQGNFLCKSSDIFYIDQYKDLEASGSFSTIVYPDISDEVFCNALIKQTAESMQNNEETISNNILSQILGVNWLDRVKEQGNRISEADALAELAKIAKKHEADNAESFKSALLKLHPSNIYAVAATLFFRDLKEVINKHSIYGIVNHDEVNLWKNSYLESYKSEFVDKSVILREEASAVGLAEFKTELENNTGREERLQKIAEYMDRSSSSHEFNQRILREVYDIKDPKQRFLTLIADLHATGIKEFSNASDATFIEDENTYDKYAPYLANIFNASYSYNSSLTKASFIEKFKDGIKEEINNEVILNEKEQDIADSLEGINLNNFETFRNFLLANSVPIEARLVTEDASGRSGRWTNRIYAGQQIGLLSKDGKNITKDLFAGKYNRNKEKYSAQFAMDVGDFKGAWWFIDIESDLNALAKEISSYL